MVAFVFASAVRAEVVITYVKPEVTGLKIDDVVTKSAVSRQANAMIGQCIYYKGPEFVKVEQLRHEPTQVKWKAWKSYSDNKCTKSWSSGYNEATLISYRDGFVCAPPKEMINGVCQEQEDCAASKGMTETIDYFPSQLGGYPGNYCGKDNCAMAPVSTTCNGATGSDEQCTGVYEYTGAECAHDPIAPDTNVDIGDKLPALITIAIPPNTHKIRHRLRLCVLPMPPKVRV